MKILWVSIKKYLIRNKILNLSQKQLWVIFVLIFVLIATSLLMILNPFIFLFILFNYDETFRKLKYLLFASQPIPAQLFITLV